MYDHEIDIALSFWLLVIWSSIYWHDVLFYSKDRWKISFIFHLLHIKIDRHLRFISRSFKTRLRISKTKRILSIRISTLWSRFTCMSFNFDLKYFALTHIVIKSQISRIMNQRRMNSILITKIENVDRSLRVFLHLCSDLISNISQWRVNTFNRKYQCSYNAERLRTQVRKEYSLSFYLLTIHCMLENLQKKHTRSSSKWTRHLCISH